MTAMSTGSEEKRDAIEALAAPLPPAPVKPPYASPIQSKKGWMILGAVVLVIAIPVALWLHFRSGAPATSTQLDQAKSSCEQFINQRITPATATFSGEEASGTRTVQQVTGHVADSVGGTADFTCLIKLTDSGALVNLESLQLTNVVAGP